MTKAYVIEEGTTNLVRNPSGISTNSWSSAVADQSIAVVNDDPHEGDTCLMFESRGTGAGFLVGATGEDIVDGTTYTASVYVKAPDQRPVGISLHCSYSDDGSYYANSESFSLEPNVWTRIQVTGVVPDPRGTITSARARVTTPNDVDGTLVWYADSAQFEAKPYATSFTHGDMGEGYSWEGTPHSSASIREPSSISIPTPEPTSLYYRYSEDGENWISGYSDFSEIEDRDPEPTLLLRPEGSRDRDGEVTPTVGANVQVVDGQYGNAWDTREGAIAMTLPFDYSPTGTVLMRLKRMDEPFDNNEIFLTLGSSSALRLQIYRTSTARVTLGGLGSSTDPIYDHNQWDNFDLTWRDDDSGNATYESVRVGSSVTKASHTSERGFRMSENSASYAWKGLIESFVMFPNVISESDIQRISTMPEAWTWDNTLVPKVYAPLGEHSYLRYVDGKLEARTRKKLYIGTVIGFSRPLSQKEVAILDSTPLAYINGKTLLNLPDTTIGVSQLL